MKAQEKNILKQYVPENAVEKVAELIEKYGVHFKITKSRSTKLGDYRPPLRVPYHRITVNHDLNKYAFLITFIHEIAHLLVFEKYKNKVSSPHGNEWKKEYRDLMQEFIVMNVFSEDLTKEISKSLINSKASSMSEVNLYRVLKKYDDKSNETEGVVELENLHEGVVFVTKNGQLFRKGGKQRVRYKCLNLNNNRWYLFHPLTPVKPVDN